MHYSREGPLMQTHADRLHQYINPPYLPRMAVACVWCGHPAGEVDTTSLMASMMWLRAGKICDPCWGRQQDARSFMDEEYPLDADEGGEA